MERGRSLSELGRSMRWSDLRAFIGFLPASSHFRREEEPEQARALAWLEGLSTPQAALLGDLVDLIEADMLLRAGQNPPDRTAIQRLAQRATAGEKQRAQVESKPKGKKRKTPEEIRAQLGLKKPANN
nr:MAG TPA: hypothetical protein [Caudoviricetes sp.]